MLKYYKKIVVIGAPKENRGSDSSEQPSKAGFGFSNLLSLLAMLGGALTALLLLSAFFALLLIPGSILAVMLWRMFRKSRNNRSDRSIDAEYTVIENPSKNREP